MTNSKLGDRETLETLIFYRYLVNTSGPSQRLYDIISRSLLPKEVNLALNLDGALTPKVKELLECSYNHIRPALNRGSILNRNQLFTCLDGGGGVQTENFELFSANLKTLLTQVVEQERSEFNLLEDRLSPTFILRLSKRSAGDEFLALYQQNKVGSMSLKERFQIIYCSALQAKYMESKYGEAARVYPGLVSTEFLETISVLSNQGGLYENLDMAISAAFRLQN